MKNWLLVLLLLLLLLVLGATGWWWNGLVGVATAQHFPGSPFGSNDDIPGSPFCIEFINFPSLPSFPLTSCPIGVVMLGQMNSLLQQPNSDKTFLDGYAPRVTWMFLDTGTVDDTPIYDWTYIDALFTNAAAQTNNHKVMLYVWTAEPPAHVFVAHGGVSVDTYIPYISGAYHTCPVPWDAVALNDLARFYYDLANHLIGGVALKNRPELAGIRSDFLGLKGLRDTGEVMVNDPAYVRAPFIAGILTSIQSCIDAFPNIPIYIEMHAMYDATVSPRLDTATIDAIAARFDGISQPTVGVFTENLNTTIPDMVSQTGINYLHAISHRSDMGFQAVAVFGSAADMGTAIDFGFTNYGSRYFEIYRTNTNSANPAYGILLEYWQNIVNAP